MIGLIASQIRITGDLEKDQQLLIYGIGALIGLIVLAMIVILVIVLVRRGKASRAAAMVASATELPTEDTYKPVVAVESAVQNSVVEPIQEEVPETVAAKEPEPTPTMEANPSTPVALIAPEEPQPEKNEEVPQKKYDFGAYKEELSHQNPDDKMEEIRRRLEEIKRQRHADPAPVLPKVEAKQPEHEITPTSELEHDPIVSEEEMLAEEEMDETRPINEVPDPETVPITEVPQMERLEPAEPQMEPEEETVVAQELPTETQTASAEEEHSAPQEPSIREEPVTGSVENEPKPEREEIRSEGEVYYTLPNEPVMELQRDPRPEPVDEPKPQKAETAESPFPNGKFLPMKKLTFAEWVELFK